MVASHLHLWCHMGPSLQEGDARRGSRGTSRQCQKTPRMGMTRHGWSRGIAGVHWKRMDTKFCWCAPREAEKAAGHNAVPSFRSCLAPKLLCCQQTSMKHPVTSYSFPQLIYRWVLTILSSFLSQVSVGSEISPDLLRSQKVSFTWSQDYSLSPATFALALSHTLHLYYTENEVF